MPFIVIFGKHLVVTKIVMRDEDEEDSSSGDLIPVFQRRPQRAQVRADLGIQSVVRCFVALLQEA